MASAKLSVSTSSSGTRTKWTISFWVKRSDLSNENCIVGSYLDNNNKDKIAFHTDGKLSWGSFQAGSYTNMGNLVTNRVFRDVNAWYHIVCRWDTGNSTANDRMKIWVNGVEETSFGTRLNPELNRVSLINYTTYTTIGNNGASGNYFDGSLSHVHFCDNYAYSASDFGETDTTTGIWKPKTAPSVNYGTNGFFLKFDNSANMGLDSSGNSNNLTTNGTIIQTKDTPSNVFACLNRLDFDSSNTTLTNINSTLTGGNQGVAYNTVRANMGATKGKWYWEVKAADNAEIDQIGVSEMTFRPAIGNTGGFTSNINAYGVQLSNGYKVGLGQSGAAYMGGFSANDIMMIALDLDNDKITFGKNGQWADGSGNVNQTYGNSTAAFTGLTSDLGYMPTQCMRDSAGNNSGTSHYNFGGGVFGTSAVASAQSPDDGIGVFEYDPPTGFRAWCTKSLTAQEFN